MAHKKFGAIQVYTGEGKGKTTAAIGAAIRALGHGKKVFMVQFMKANQKYGEIFVANKIKDFIILPYGRKCFINKSCNITRKDRKLAQLGFSKTKEVASSNKYDILILDELNVAVDFGLLNVKDVLEFLKTKPEKLEIIITGRNAHPEIIRISDLVSEIKEVKHYYKKNIKVRKGIEY